MHSCNNAAGEKFFQRGAPAGRSPPPPLTRVLKEARPSLALSLFNKHLDDPIVLPSRLLFMNIVIKRGDVLEELARNALAKLTFLQNY